jgi:hypothetical protein
MDDEKKGDYDARAKKFGGGRRIRKDATVKTLRDVYGLDPRNANGRKTRSDKTVKSMRKKK